jgi:Core-2/I-Branching enzyme
MEPDFIITLSGQDYPLRSNDEIVSFFEQHPGHSFVEFKPLTDPGLGQYGRGRISCWWLLVKGRYLPVPGVKAFSNHALSLLWNNTVARAPVRRSFLPGLTPYGGSAWWCLSAERARRTMNYVATHPEFSRFYDRVFIPDEQFFNTIVGNDPDNGDVLNQNLHYIDWEGMGSHPRSLTEADLERMLSSGRLFGRKFEHGSAVLNHLDEIRRARLHD